MEDEAIVGNVGMYEVTFGEPLGSGTFGVVHRAVHSTTKQEVAAKQIIIGDKGRINKDMLSMAQRELKIMQELQNHPNIVKVYEHVIKKNVCWLFIEFCELNNLSTYLQDKKNLPLLSRLKIMLQSASAVAFMHRLEPAIIHRDIKLENILLKHEGNEDVVKLTDFGVSKLCADRQSLSQVLQTGHMMSTTCGSQYFMAPEFFAELEGGTQYDSSVDTFSLGLVFLVVKDSELMPDLIPLSVSSREVKRYVSIGQEMVTCYKTKAAMPHVVDLNSPTQCNVTKRTYRIIDNMTRFSCKMRKNIDEVEMEIAEMISQIDHENSQKKRVESMRSALQMKERKIQSLEENNLEQSDSIESLRERIATLEALKRIYIRKNTSLAQKNKTLNDNEKENKCLLEEKDANIQDLQGRIDVLQEQISNHEQLEKEMCDLKSRNKQLEDKVESIESEVDYLKECYEEIGESHRYDIDALFSKLQSAHDDNSDLQDAHKKQMNELRTEFAAQIDQAQREIKEYEDQENWQSDRIEDLEQSVEYARDKLRKEKASRKAENAMLNAKLKSSEGDKTRLITSHAHYIEELQFEHDVQLEDLEKQREQLETQNSSLTDRIEAFQHENDSLKEKLQREQNLREMEKDSFDKRCALLTESAEDSKNCLKESHAEAIEKLETKHIDQLDGLFYEIENIGTDNSILKERTECLGKENIELEDKLRQEQNDKTKLQTQTADLSNRNSSLSQDIANSKQRYEKEKESLNRENTTLKEKNKHLVASSQEEKSNLTKKIEVLQTQNSNLKERLKKIVHVAQVDDTEGASSLDYPLLRLVLPNTSSTTPVQSYQSPYTSLTGSRMYMTQYMPDRK